MRLKSFPERKKKVIFSINFPQIHNQKLVLLFFVIFAYSSVILQRISVYGILSPTKNSLKILAGSLLFLSGKLTDLPPAPNSRKFQSGAEEQGGGRCLVRGLQFGREEKGGGENITLHLVGKEEEGKKWTIVLQRNVVCSTV